MLLIFNLFLFIIYYIFSSFSFFYVKKMFISIFSLISVTFGAVAIFDQAFVKSIKSCVGEHVFVVSFLKGKNFVIGGM